MMILRKIKTALRMPLPLLYFRLSQEVRVYWDRIFLPYEIKKFTVKRLLAANGAKQLDELWLYLAGRQKFTAVASCNLALMPVDDQQVKFAMDNQVALLGSGLIALGATIDWHQDYKTGKRWHPQYFRDIDYCNPELPSDVKFPWELSRMQWLIPVAQSYHVTKEEIYAEKVKNILSDWIVQNPIAGSVNWACTMEVAMRVFVWIWFFHIFHDSIAWQDNTFRQQFLLNLYWHGIFIQRYMEVSTVNGNHYTADAAALVTVGLFWWKTKTAQRWLDQGWRGLTHEINQQVYSDGVNFEASTAYHRLVTELFFIIAKARQDYGLSVPVDYLERLQRMAYYIQAYMRPDGTCPLWGDADDARVLPFRVGAINDHRYLIGLMGLLLNDPQLLAYDLEDYQEVIWWYGPDCRARFGAKTYLDPQMIAFEQGGVYIMRHQQDHIFIDCGRVGLADRGGHGHNDCLGFTAMLQGCDLVSDRGAYCYTASYEQRNLFRATASHNTPQIDSQEMNRFIAPNDLWNVHYDAKPTVITWHQGEQSWIFSGTHAGYQRLATPIQPLRTLTYYPNCSQIIIHDAIQGEGHHQVTIPLHLAAEVGLAQDPRGYILHVKQQQFLLTWQSQMDWEVMQVPSTLSPSYGIKIATESLIWRYHGKLPVALTVTLQPYEALSVC